MRERVPDLVSLQLLRAIDETGTVGRAAARLGMSQQAASSRVRGAEAMLGCSLVVRTRAGSTLTDQGRLVVAWSAGFLAAAEQLALSVGTLRTEAVEVLTVAASQTISEQLLPRWMTEFRHRSGGEGRLRLTSGNSASVIERVRTGAAAVGLIETPEIPADLASSAVRDDELVVVVGPDHPWTGRSTPLTAQELAREPLVTREAGSGTRRALELALAAVDPGLVLARPVAELSTSGAIRAAVAGGAGPAVLSASTVQDDLLHGVLRRVPLDGVALHRPITALWRSGVTLPASAEVFFSVLAGGSTRATSIAWDPTGRPS